MAFKKLYSAPWTPEEYKKAQEELNKQQEDEDGFNKEESEFKKTNNNKHFSENFDKVN